MALEPATPEDIPAIMAIERDPAYALFIGSFEADEHTALMASTDARYLAWRADVRPHELTTDDVSAHPPPSPAPAVRRPPPPWPPCRAVSG